METYKDLKVRVAHIMRGHRWTLFFWLFFASFVLSVGKDYIGIHVDKKILGYASFVVSMLYFIVIDGVLFLFIKRVKKESFSSKDIVYIFTKIPYILLTCILLNLFQLLVMEVLSLTAILLPLYYIVFTIANLVFLLWNALIAYGIYDGNTKFKELFMGSLNIIFSNFKTIMKIGVWYMVWYVIIQLAISYILLIGLNHLQTVNIFEVIGRASHASPAVWIATIVVYILNYTVEYFMFVPIYIGVACLYETKRHKVMPSGTRNNKEILDEKG